MNEEIFGLYDELLAAQRSALVAREGELRAGRAVLNAEARVVKAGEEILRRYREVFGEDDDDPDVEGEIAKRVIEEFRLR